jgi:CubicO group peptidase (beta-lactamase class C family)
VADCIQKRIFPGCQVWAARDGEVFLMKSYGHHTYDKTMPVKDFDVYDLASLTKIAATTLSVMSLQDQGKIDIDKQLVTYLPELQGTDKSRIIIREMMAHQARLKPWIPFYKYTLTEGKPDSTIYRSKPEGAFDVRVAENLYIRESYKQVIFDSIRNSSLLKSNSYKYSDLGFIYLAEIIGTLAGESIDNYAHDRFYAPLGLSTNGYLPRYRFPLSRIVPTEQDKIFRNQLIHGDVHDPGAAMLGGISGHAGLFSNANDLGIIGQMLLERGTYGGIQYLRHETVQDYTSCQFPLNSNRRGVGFDKPLPEFSTSGPVCWSASKDSFGHSGFTGTYLWIDPAEGLVYIFLSNRVHPDAENTKLSGQNIREKIHQYLYDAIKKSANFAPKFN